MDIVKYLIIAVILVSVCYAETFELDFSDYNIQKTGDYSLINIDHDSIMQTQGFIVLPKSAAVHTFPKGTLIKGVEIVELNDPVKLKANIPSFTGDYSDRICVNNEQKAQIKDSVSLGEQVRLSVELFPVEIVDCAKGDFILYQKIKYKVDYLTKDKISFLRKLPESLDEGKKYDLDIRIDNVFSGTVDGKFVIKAGEKVLGEKEVLIDKPMDIKVPFTAPEKGRYYFAIEFQYDGGIVSREDWISVLGTEIKIQAPSTLLIGQDLEINVTGVENPLLSIMLRKGEYLVTNINTNNSMIIIPTKDFSPGSYMVDITESNSGSNKLKQITLKEYQEPVKEKSPKNNNLIGILIAIALIILVVWVAYFFFRKR